MYTKNFKSTLEKFKIDITDILNQITCLIYFFDRHLDWSFVLLVTVILPCFFVKKAAIKSLIRQAIQSGRFNSILIFLHLVTVIAAIPFLGFDTSSYLKLFFLYVAALILRQLIKDILLVINFKKLITPFKVNSILSGIMLYCYIYGYYLNLGFYLFLFFIYNTVIHLTNQKKSVSQEIKQKDSNFQSQAQSISIVEKDYEKYFPYFDKLYSFNFLLVFIIINDKLSAINNLFFSITTHHRLLLHAILVIGLVFWMLIRISIVICSNISFVYKGILIFSTIFTFLVFLFSFGFDFHDNAVQPGKTPLKGLLTRYYQKYFLGYIPLTNFDSAMGAIYTQIMLDRVPVKTIGGVEDCLDSDLVRERLVAKGVKLPSLEEVVIADLERSSFK